jgi:hypothetical protein
MCTLKLSEHYFPFLNGNTVCVIMFQINRAKFPHTVFQSAMLGTGKCASRSQPGDRACACANQISSTSCDNCDVWILRANGFEVLW